MPKKISTAKNAGYQTVYQILTIITPLLTSPHISRAMGADNLGKYTYSFSIVTYFMLFALLGVVNYGTRSIAQCKDDIRSRSRTFFSIYAVQAVTSLLAIAGYAVYVVLLGGFGNVSRVEVDVALLQGIWLLGALLDVCWLFFGIESFRQTVIRNIIIKLLTVAAVLIFVRKDQNPVMVYTLIMAGGHLASSLILLPMLRGQIRFERPRWADMKPHIKPILTLFIPLLAASVFHTMDKTMLGWLAPGAASGSQVELGYYYNADKLVNIPLGVLNGFGIVFLPRASRLFAKKEEDGTVDKKSALLFLDKTFELNICVTALLAFGIAGCAKEFVPLFFGPGYDPCVALAYMFVPVLVVKASSAFCRMQYLVPSHREKIYAIATIVGAGVNLVANVLLIPESLFGIPLAGLGAMGAVIGTLIAELAVMLVQFLCCRKELPLKKWLFSACGYVVIGGLMLGGMRAVSLLPLTRWWKVLAEVAAGGILFGGLCLLYWMVFPQKRWIPKLLLRRRPKQLAAAKAEPRQKDYAISLMRLLGFCLVVACHICLFYEIEAAWWLNVGAQLFLVISGYLYGSRERLRVRQFYWRNFVKILVDYYLFLLVIVPVYLFVAKVSFSPKQYVFLLLGLNTGVGGLGHFWYIGTVLLCYLVTPLVFWIRRQRLRWLLLLLLFVVVEGACIVIPGLTGAWINCYIIAMLLGDYYRRSETKTRFLKRLLCVSVLAMLLICGPEIYLKYVRGISMAGVTGQALNTVFHYGHIALALVIFLSIFLAFREGRGILRSKALRRVLDVFDTYSYDAYIVHLFLISGPFSVFAGKYGAGQILLGIAILIAYIAASAFVLHFVSRRVTRLLLQRRTA